MPEVADPDREIRREMIQKLDEVETADGDERYSRVIEVLTIVVNNKAFVLDNPPLRDVLRNKAPKFIDDSFRLQEDGKMKSDHYDSIASLCNAILSFVT